MVVWTFSKIITGNSFRSCRESQYLKSTYFPFHNAFDARLHVVHRVGVIVRMEPQQLEIVRLTGQG